MTIMNKAKFKIFILTSTPLLVIMLFIPYCYITAALSGFKGRRGGYQDAFRHTYASAIVARYISPKAVSLVTYLIENKAKYSKHNIMDTHNNMLGIKIGTSGSNIYETVFQKIENAKEFNSDPNGAYILPKKEWSNGL